MRLNPGISRLENFRDPGPNPGNPGISTFVLSQLYGQVYSEYRIAQKSKYSVLCNILFNVSYTELQNTLLESRYKILFAVYGVVDYSRTSIVVLYHTQPTFLRAMLLSIAHDIPAASHLERAQDE